MDGYQWGAERVGPLSQLIQGGGVPYCFCEFCRAKGREKGIDAERARQGMLELHDYMREKVIQSNTLPVEGVITGAMSYTFRYPEILAWERLWREAKESLAETMFGVAKSITPAADCGEHVDHPSSTYDLLYLAVMSYAEMAYKMDFIKPILYQDIAGPRTRSMYLSRVRRSIFKQLSDQEALDLFYTLHGYDEKVEPKLSELDSKSLGPDYVYVETKRCVDEAAGHSRVYSGIGVDIPGNNKTFSSDPEIVYQSVLKAFQAGAEGVLISREYDEMRLPNLRAVGRAMREVNKA